MASSIDSMDATTTDSPEQQAAPGVDVIDVEAVNRAGERPKMPLYAKREPIYPKRVKGFFRTFKWWIMAVTLGIYYITPWIRWDRPGDAPDQAVLIDFPARRFYFFFIEIWPQEVYYITGLLVMAALGLFLVTSVVGRAWCGYTCPQTVWTDLFIAVERWVEGDRAARMRLDKAPMSAGKVTKRTIKYTIWLLIAAGTGGAWVFYFADAPTLFIDLFTGYAPPIAYMTVGVLTFTTFTLGGFMREQVCTYMCPWPRIQAAMMDEESLTVAYKPDRGEPRGPYRKGESFENRGDCVDCKACVAACPMGIDIRDGQQLECITCALCIDACDDVMQKIGRPRGLIDYDSLANLDRRVHGEPMRLRFIRPRTIIYATIFALVGLLMLYVLATRSNLDINVLHERTPLYVELQDGSLRNVYTFKILNKAHAQRTFRLTVQGLGDDTSMEVVGSENVADNANPYFTVKPDRLASYRLLVTAPRHMAEGASTDITFVLTDVNDPNAQATADSYFRGPEN